MSEEKFAVRKYKGMIDAMFRVKQKNNMLTTFFCDGEIEKKEYSLKDTGNGVVFYDHNLRKKLELTYCQLDALEMLSTLTNQDTEWKVYEEVK